MINADSLSSGCNSQPAPRVVVYTDSLGMGGAEFSLGHLVAAVSRDIAITVLGVSATVVDAIASQRPGAEKIVLPPTGFTSIAAHLATLHRLRPDIVHLNLCTPWAGATGLAAALTLPQARVVRVDQLPLRTTDAIALWRTRSLSLRVDAHVAVGEASARRMEDFYALGRNTVISVPNGVPDVEVEPAPSPVLKEPMLVVGSVGRLDAMKAHDILLRAIAQVDDTHVVVWGDGAERQALEHLAQDLGIGDRVSLPGWVNNPRAHLPNVDIFVLPSRSEGFPLAIVEAMLAARPVIATRVGSVAEAVIEQETGLLIEKNDVMGLVNALRRLKNDAALREQMGQRGRAVAVAQFTAQAMAQRYEQIWRQLLASPRSPRLRVPRPRD
ncbi:MULTISPECIES: glycosyltransferase family 4 protein [Cyanophyceae]|uniref:Glycosyltransferase family 4 protein n=1 Tax=Leptolyngbya subtilissima DQ-A4 TaxID=2933933 RepID=A0ABV0K0Z5_9CYAN|nr:glycosyltransferase family 4 protein [Nodosilinea sp. FACHB-141]MBD2111215.1 glycosyltransferase family 4 protein [Nodosilinea sp. FACHB-141]